MSMSINNNIYSMNSYRHFSETQINLASSVERLSSGFRINEAADDSVGLAISEKLRAQISGQEVAIRNAQDGISIVQTADGALDRTSTILNRLHDLAELAANGDKTDNDRLHYQHEVDQLLSEIDRIGRTTEYNSMKLLDGSVGTHAEEIGDIDSINNSAKIKVVGAPKLAGEYEVVVKSQASKATAMFTSGNDGANLDVDSNFSDFVDTASVGTNPAVTGENDGTYTFRFSMDDKEVSVDLVAKDGAGDTISEALNKIDTAMNAAGMEAHAKFHSNIDESGGVMAAIEIESDNFGSAHDIRISVVNQPGNVYNQLNFFDTAGGTDSYNAVEGTAAAIYNSDRSGVDGVIDGNTVFLDTTPGTDTNALYIGPLGDIQFTDRNGVDFELSVGEDQSLNTIAANISALNGGASFTALFDEKEGNFNVFALGTGSGPIVIQSSDGNAATEDSENQMAAMLGLYGTHYGNSVVGEKVTTTVDYHLEITTPGNTSTVDVFAKFGNRSTKFDAVDSNSAVTESMVDPDQLGIESPGAGGISGIEFQLEEKTLAGGEKFSLLVNSGNMELQIGANDGSINRMEVSFDKISTDSLGISGMDITTQANAQSLMDNGSISTASAKVATTRAKLGAIQNRLGHTLANLSITSVNLSSAESRIRDTDYAKETMGFTKHQIMSQAGASMLRTANMMPSMVLDLIG